MARSKSNGNRPKQHNARNSDRKNTGSINRPANVSKGNTGGAKAKKHMAVFDFDGTLINGDSFMLFARHALGMPKIMTAAMKSLPALLKWKLAKGSGTEAKKVLFKNLYAGASVEQLNRKAQEFADVLDQHIRPEIFEKFLQLTRHGAICVLLTASMDFWVRPWAERHGFGCVIATQPMIANGALTGEFATANCKGREKVTRLSNVFPKRDAYFIEAWGDSESDRPILDYANQGHFVKGAKDA